MNNDVIAVAIAGIFTLLAIVVSALVLGGIVEMLGGPV